MNILPLLDELQAIGQSGIEDAESPYDRKRNERILELVSEYYGKSAELPPDEIRERLAEDVGYPTAKVGASITVFNDEGQILLINWTSHLYKDPFEFIHETVYSLISIVQRPRQQILHRFLQRVFEIVAQRRRL